MGTLVQGSGVGALCQDSEMKVSDKVVLIRGIVLSK